MFLYAQLSLTPSTGVDGNFGQSAKGRPFEESDAVTTAALLQQLTLTMRHAGLSDASLLSRNGEVIYRDRLGAEDDLTVALRTFARKSTAQHREDFETLRLLMDHEGSLLFVTVDTRVSRIHAAGESPIVITVTGLMRAFCIEGECDSDFDRVFNPVFGDQTDYDEVCHAARMEFTQLVDVMQAAARQHLGARKSSRMTR